MPSSTSDWLDRMESMIHAAGFSFVADRWIGGSVRAFAWFVASSGGRLDLELPTRVHAGHPT